MMEAVLSVDDKADEDDSENDTKEEDIVDDENYNERDKEDKDEDDEDDVDDDDDDDKVVRLTSKNEEHSYENDVILHFFSSVFKLVAMNIKD
jgi:hypothetical protein